MQCDATQRNAAVASADSQCRTREIYLAWQPLAAVIQTLTHQPQVHLPESTAIVNNRFHNEVTGFSVLAAHGSCTWQRTEAVEELLMMVS